MIIREVRPEEKDEYNKVVNHPLQSWQWGDFREQTGVEVIRLGQFEGKKIVKGLQLTLHPIPKFPFTIGYCPRSIIPDPKMFQALKDLAHDKNIIFIKLEPNFFQVARDNSFPKSEEYIKQQNYMFSQGCQFGKPQFTKYSFFLDLRKNEDQLLKEMKSKTRYNTRLAIKKGVKIIFDNSKESFDEYLRLTFEETTVRQKFYAHNREYHSKMWQQMRKSGTAHLIKAIYNNQTIVTWIVFIFNNTLYYPYGASSSQNRNVMASNLVMWEVIKFGKKMGCKYFDMWGALGPQPDPKDPWIGFHKFKQGYGGTLMEFIGTYDLVIDLPKYQIFKMLDKIRWGLLKIKAQLPF